MIFETLCVCTQYCERVKLVVAFFLKAILRGQRQAYFYEFKSSRAYLATVRPARAT